MDKLFVYQPEQQFKPNPLTFYQTQITKMAILTYWLDKIVFFWLQDSYLTIVVSS